MNLNSIIFRNKFFILINLILLFSLFPDKLFSSENNLQISKRVDCSLIKKNPNYGYERQKVHDFGRLIQKLFVKKDLEGIYKIAGGDLNRGPRKKYALEKGFDYVFPEEFVRKIISSEVSCDSVGWRGFMIGDGEIWYYLKADSSNKKFLKDQFILGAVNSPNQEVFENPKKLIGWETKKGIISPVCFHRWGGGERSYIASFQKFLKLKDQKILNRHPGVFIGREFPLGSQFKGDIHNLSFTSKMENCYSEVVLVSGRIYQKNLPRLSKGSKRRSGTNYKILEKLDKATCQSFAPNLKARCKEGYLLRIGYDTTGSIGPFVMYNTYGIFEDSNGADHMVPLKYSYTKNGALNYLRP